MKTPKTSILQPATRYPVGQATSDSKGSSTPGLAYSPNVPNERKVHVQVTTPMTDLSSDSYRAVNTHPEHVVWNSAKHSMRNKEHCRPPILLR